MRRTMKVLICSAAAVIPNLFASAMAQERAVQPTKTSSSVESDIVVTARRSTESIQSVPISVTAFTNKTIMEKTILDTRDLTQQTPGVVFTASGGSYNVNLTIRGMTRAVTGAGLPSVLTYINEVPMPTIGSNIPTFDLSSVQVLKGPQGTFFGRNSTGGLLLTYTQEPTYEAGGYVQATLGDYHARIIEGALNIPLVADRLSLRLAGQISHHDGYTENVSGGPAFDDLHRHAIRVSLLAEPFDWLSNSTVLDYFETDNTGGSITPVRLNNGPSKTGASAAALAPFYNCGTSSLCDINLAYAHRQQIGPFRQATNLARPFDRSTIYGVSNTTTIELGGITIKNIFGFRSSKIDVLNDTDGTELAVVTSRLRNGIRQITEEIQFSGKLWDDRIDWRLGGFYLSSKPSGDVGLINAITPLPTSTYFDGHNFFEDQSRAVFATVTIDMSSLIDGLKVNVGGRYTKDTQQGCSIVTPTTSFLATITTYYDECRRNPATFKGKTTAEEPTYTVGLDYQVTDDLFLYVTKRRGYRGGGFNSPGFGGTLVPYQTYAPEFIDDYEGGVKATWRRGGMRGFFNLSAFTGSYKNIQAGVTVPVGFDGDGIPSNDPSGTALTVNRGRARIKGLELQAMISPVPGLSMTGGAAYTDAYYTDRSLPALFARNPLVGGNDATFSATPEWTVTANARYELKLDGAVGSVIFNTDYYYSSKIMFVALTAPAYSVVNARIDVTRIGGSGLDMAVFMRNVFDKAYVVGGNLTGSTNEFLAGHFAAPRTFGVQATFRF